MILDDLDFGRPSFLDLIDDEVEPVRVGLILYDDFDVGVLVLISVEDYDFIHLLVDVVVVELIKDLIRVFNKCQPASFCIQNIKALNVSVIAPSILSRSAKVVNVRAIGASMIMPRANEIELIKDLRIVAVIIHLSPVHLKAVELQVTHQYRSSSFVDRFQTLFAILVTYPRKHKDL